MILHVDADGFYASCERLFRPDLAGKPIAVLSNSDCRVIALNEEAGLRGLRRGDVWIKPASGQDTRDISVFFSNYSLYADIGSRLVSIYNRLCPNVEVLSLHGAFLRYPDRGCPDFAGIAAHLRNTVLREIGIPVSVGAARTRTLARLAGSLARAGNGVCVLEGAAPDSLLAETPVSELQGIGQTTVALLRRLGVSTALELRDYRQVSGGKGLDECAMRLKRELSGIPAVDTPETESADGISLTSSFSEPVFTLSELEEALVSSAEEAVRRLKDRSGRAAIIAVHLMTDGAAGTGPGYCNQLSVRLDAPTASLSDIVRTSAGLLRRMYRQGLPYRKVMISLLALDDDRTSSLSPVAGTALFSPKRRQARRFTASGPAETPGSLFRPGPHLLDGRVWNLKRRPLSPAYTTDVRGIPEVF